MSEETESPDQQQQTTPQLKETQDRRNDFGKKLRQRLEWLKTMPHVYEDPMLIDTMAKPEFRGVKPINLFSFEAAQWSAMRIYKPGGDKAERDVIGLTFQTREPEGTAIYFYEIEPGGEIEAFKRAQGETAQKIAPGDVGYDELARFLEPNLIPLYVSADSVPEHLKLIEPPIAKKDKPQLIRRILRRKKS